MEENQPTANSEANVQPSPHPAPKPKQHRKHVSPKPAQKKDSEDIDIDFGFVKNIFKSKGKAKEHHESRKEDLDLKLPGMNLFKKSDSHKQIAKTEGEDLSLNFSFKSLGSIVWKYRILFLILIPLIMSMYVRLPSATLPITDEWATGSVVGYFKSQIADQVSQQYPNLPENNRNAIVEQEWQKFVKENKQAIDQNIAAASAQFKSHFQYEANGRQYTYMPDIDPYFWLRYARNYVEKGHMGDEVRDGVEWDTHMFAPLGTPAQAYTHNKIIAWIYKIMSIFNPKIPLMQAAGYLPVIFAALSIIPSFFIGRRIAGNVGGFFSAMMVAVAPSFASRTPWGHADTDAYNVFFPLLIIWLIFESYAADKLNKKLILAGVAGLTTAIYSRFWVWWYVFDFVLAAIGLYIIYLLFAYRSELRKGIKDFFNFPAVKNNILLALSFIVVTSIFMILFAGFTDWWQGLLGPIKFTSLKVASQENLWPNVYTTVAELNEIDFAGMINAVGGKLLFWISVLGIVLAFLKRDAHGKADIRYGLLMAIWFAGTIYASTQGIRFTLLIVPAFAVAFGIAISMVYKFVTEWAAKNFELHKAITGSVLLILFLLLLIAPARAAYNVSYRDVPIVNDVWYNALTKIKDNSQNNAIITSWWDFGHHFKFFADRPVTFDGASQNVPQAHWVGKLLLTDDEKRSVGILRMLDCGANNAFEEIDKKLNDPSLSVSVIDNMIVSDKPRAKQILLDNKFTSEESEKILAYTHCNPPEAFLITSEDMVGKAGVWSHFGSWDFKRAEIWTKVSKMPRDQAVQYMLSQKDYGFTKEQAEKIYSEVQAIRNERDANNWISPWPNYFSGKTGCDARENSTIICGNGVSIDFSSGESSVPTQQGNAHPRSLVFMQAGELVEKQYSDSTQGFSVIYTTHEGNFNIVSDPALSKSMFTRLFFMNGEGLKHYKPFFHERGPTGTDVYVWKVDWQGS